MRILLFIAGLFVVANAHAYSWSVSCDATVPNGPSYGDATVVNAPYEPGTTIYTNQASNIQSLGVPACTQFTRAYYKSQCSTLNRAESITLNTGYQLVGYSNASGIAWFVYNLPFANVSTISIAELCTVSRPIRPRPCHGCNHP